MLLLSPPQLTPSTTQCTISLPDTVAERGYFDISLGNFLPDLELVTIAVGGKPLTPAELKGHGFGLGEAPNPNNTRVFILQVPFTDPLVEQEVGA